MIKRAGFLTVLIAGYFLLPAYADDFPKKRTIQVTGEAQVKVVPDEIIIRIGVNAKDKVLSVAKRKHSKQVKSVLNTIRGFNIKEEQIHTNLVNISPKYSHNHRTNKTVFEGYRVTNRIAFTLKDFSKYDALLTEILEKGADQVYGITFHTSELRKHRDRARSMAVKHALDKATKMAGELGQKVGKPLRILEHSAGLYSLYPRQQAQPSASAVSPNGLSYEGLALGQIAINAGVNITFELE
jgi:uncharacterized protein